MFFSHFFRQKKETTTLEGNAVDSAAACELDVSKNNGTPKSSILIGFSIINYKPSILGVLPLFLETPIAIQPSPSLKTVVVVHHESMGC